MCCEYQTRQMILYVKTSTKTVKQYVRQHARNKGGIKQCYCTRTYINVRVRVRAIKLVWLSMYIQRDKSNENEFFPPTLKSRIRSEYILTFFIVKGTMTSYTINEMFCLCNLLNENQQICMKETFFFMYILREWI